MHADVIGISKEHSDAGQIDRRCHHDGHRSVLRRASHPDGLRLRPSEYGLQWWPLMEWIWSQI